VPQIETAEDGVAQDRHCFLALCHAGSLPGYVIVRMPIMIWTSLAHRKSCKSPPEIVVAGTVVDGFLT
jgi:hypothetical protein